jgi:hypothetical protein
MAIAFVRLCGHFLGLLKIAAYSASIFMKLVWAIAIIRQNNPLKSIIL